MSEGTRLPADYAPSQELIAWANERFPNCDVGLETEKFIDYWLSRAGRGGLKVDWNRTWRNWIRNAATTYAVVARPSFQKRRGFDRDENRTRIVSAAARRHIAGSGSPFDD